jgi:hypothetical protein
VANSATALNAESAVFTELGIALLTVSDRVSIRMIDARHRSSLSYN